MKTRPEKKLRAHRAACAAAVVVFLCLFFYAVVFQSAVVPELSGWYDSAGNAVELMEQRPMQQGETRTIYVLLPSTAGGHALAIRTENVSIRAWAGNLLLYETPETRLGMCPGDRLVLLTLPTQSGGALLRIETSAPLAVGCKPLRHIYYGESLTVLHLWMRSGIPSLLLNGALVFSGLVLFLSFFFRGRRLTPASWLGLAIMALSGWTLTQTPLMLAAELPHFWFVASTYALPPLAACFLFVYLAKSTGGQPLHAFYACGGLFCMVWVPLCVLLDTAGIVPYPNTRPVSLFLLFLCAVSMLICSGTALREKHRLSIQFWGFWLLLAGRGIDWVCAGLHRTTDYALYTRIGLMAFVVCVALESARGISHSIRQAARADALQRAAYLDALTGLYNRRAYERDFAALAAADADCAIVMMDIDNLKNANDQHGHKQGDELIRAAARVISGAFEGFGDCYRYGGDEFITLIRQDIESCPAALRRITRLTEAENHTNAALHPPLHISVGYALYRPDQGGTPAAAQRLADERMYANKKEGKARRATQ